MLYRTFIGATAVLIAVGSVTTSMMAQSAVPAGTVEARAVTGITAPSERLKLAIPVPGIVAERKVKAGDVVKKDQVLLQLDDRSERKALAGLEKEANSTYQVDAAVADLELRKVQLERKENMLKQMVAGLSEVEEARLQVKIGAIREKLQRQELEVKGIEYERQGLKVEQMALKSPIDGEIEAIGVGPGEWADPQKPEGLITVVKNDPLWVEMHLPVEQSQKLKAGQSLPVKYDGDAKDNEAKVIFITPVSDAASATSLVRLEMPNPQKRPAGLSVSVKLPDDVAAMAEGR